MSTLHDADRGSGAGRRELEPPDTPAQAFAALSGMFLTALGMLALVLEDVGFGAPAGQRELAIWTASGWTAVLWVAMGVLGLLSSVGREPARTYSRVACAVFAVVALWGFVDGGNIAAGTATNATHAILAGAGLAAGLLPPGAQAPPSTHHVRRLSTSRCGAGRQPGDGDAATHRVPGRAKATKGR